MQICQRYGDFGKNPASLPEILPRFSVEQFTCGLPSHKQPTLDKVKVNSVVVNQLFWPNHEIIDEALQTLYVYFEKLIRQGKTLVIGYHIDTPFDHTDEMGILEIYNRLQNKYESKNLYFLWWYQKKNLVPKI